MASEIFLYNFSVEEDESYIAGGFVVHNCLPWEGKVLSINGKTPGYKTIAEATADSHLFGNRCSHNASLYLPGVTREVELIPVEERQKNYLEKQEQRKMERTIRAWKKREAIAITPNALAEAKLQVSEWQANMRAFIAETDRVRDYARESITRAR